MTDDPYLAMIGDEWENIVALYNKLRGKEQIIEFEVTEQKIYSYPAFDYIQNLSERTRDETTREYADATKRNKFLLFVKDSENRTLRSYVFDLPK